MDRRLRAGDNVVRQLAVLSVPLVNPDPKGYYASLELQPNASPALIRAAYRVRAMELHPDRNDELLSTHNFQRLQEAFDVLSDPARRAAYDEFALRKMASRSQPPVTAPVAVATRWSRRLKMATGAIALGVVALAAVVYVDNEPIGAGSPRPVVGMPLQAVGAPAAGSMAVAPLPLPTSGILQLDLPSEAFAHPDHLPRLTLTAPRDASFLVRLNCWENNAPAMSVFVRAGDTTEVLLPIGRYRIRLASGAEWYGEALRFGPTTQYVQVDTLSDFQPIGKRLRYELMLGESAGTQIASSAF